MAWSPHWTGLEKKERYPLTEELLAARPFVPWVGGKGKLKEILYQVFPPDVNRFADHCGGSGAVLLGLPPNAGRLDVYNDFDSEDLPYPIGGGVRHAAGYVETAPAHPGFHPG